MNLEEMYKLREKREKEIISEGTEEKQRRAMIIRKFKEYNKGRKPTEAEIQKDIDYLKKIKKTLRNKMLIPMIGPDDEKCPKIKK